MNTRKKFFGGLAAGAAALALTACLMPVGDGEGLAPSGDVPPAVVNLQQSIQPIFTANCSGCHNSGAGAGFANLKLATYDLTVASLFEISGTDTTEVDAFSAAGAGKKRVVRGSPEESHLYERVSSNGSIKMPPTSDLEESEIALIRQWIEEGARLQPPPAE